MSKKITEKGISRRSFITTAAAAGAIAAVSGMAGCSPQSSTAGGAEGKPTESEASNQTFEIDWIGNTIEEPTDIEREIDCDVVICGCGHAGVSAARAAAENGASVVVFEKGGDFGLKSSAIAAFGSKQWLEHFPSDEKYFSDDMRKLIIDTVSKLSLYRNNAELCARWAELNGEAFDWYVGAAGTDIPWADETNGNKLISPDDPYAIKVEGFPYPEHYNPLEENLPCVPGTASLACNADMKAEGGFLKLNLDKAKEAAGDNLSVFTYAPVVKLLTENGRVTGAIAQDADGKYIKANAKNGIVMATGDFMSDEAMLRRFCPRMFDEGFIMGGSMYSVMDKDGKPTNTGDGHKIAASIGAAVQMDGVNMSHLISAAGARGVFGTLPFLWLDMKGKRFFNEDVQGQQFAEKIRELPEQMAIQFFDANWPSQIPYMPYGHGKVGNTTTQATIDERVADGSLVTADTLEELIAQLDIDREAALASIARYNELCATGIDIDFGKNSNRMFPLDTPPFYANTCNRGDDLVTMSGLLCDTECRVLDTNSEVIPGLYVAGNSQGGRFAVIYPEVLQGHSVAMAVTFGRLAGENAAKAI